MSDTLTTITHLINSPPGQLAAGGVLAGIVWKFFERVEAVLTDHTKLEIAVWLLGVKVGQKVEPWPDTFAKVFDRVFGTRHLSWKCFWRSVVCSYTLALCGLLLVWQERRLPLLSVKFTIGFVVSAVVANAVPDYFSLLKSRLVLQFMARSHSVKRWVISIAFDTIVTLYIAALCAIASV